MAQIIHVITVPDLDTGNLYEEIAFRQYLENHDIDHLTDEQENELIELYNKAYRWDK